MANAAAFLQETDRGLPVGPRIYRLLRERVVTGDLLPGTRLSEMDVAGTYAVSRQPVREAFIKLAEEALVEIRPQRGTFVSRIQMSAVMSARFVREAVEADIVRILAASPDGTVVSRLHDNLARQADVVDDADPRGFLQLDEAFHRMLAVEAGHGASWDILQPLKTQMDRVRHLSARAFPLRQLLAQHREVVEAIEAGHVAAAEQAMRGHLRKILGDLSQIAAAAPAHFEAGRDGSEGDGA